MFGGATRRNELKELIKNEARAISKLCAPGAHKNLVAVFRQGEVEDTTMFYYDMELCQRNLEDFIQQYCTKEQRITMSALWDIMQQIACGVAFIHEQGEVHRDLKPRNSTSSAMSTTDDS